MQLSQIAAALITLSVIFLPGSQAQERKGDSPKATSEEKNVTKEKKLSGTKVTGKLIKLDTNERSFTVQLKIAKENQSAIQNIANLEVQLRNAIRNRDKGGIANAGVELEKNKANLVTYVDGPPVDFFTDDNFKVRTMIAPVEFDEKGKPRKLTEKEKKALKGPDPKAPGFVADFDSLKQGQLVDVYLPKTKRSAEKKKPAKGEDEPANSKERLKALMLVIRAEP
jgi:hypothetical protein